MKQMAINAKKASLQLSLATTESKNKILTDIAKALKENAQYIYAENKKDIVAAKEAGISEALIDRLTISEKVINSMAESALQVASLPDPVNRIISEYKRPDGLEIKKVAVPFGVIGIIFEARPNVTVDSALLCIKSGNAVILRGGKEALNSNMCLSSLIRKVLRDNGFDENCVNLITDTNRTSATELMNLKGYIDLLIPRGGKGLIKSVTENASVPVIETGAGNCHIYVDENADIELAAKVIHNAKTSRPSVCNAAESLLVHKNIAKEALPVIKEKLKGVELRGCEKTLGILPDINKASEEDFYTEYNDYIMSVKIVESLDEAISHINEHGTMHSESIITRNDENAALFMNQVDAAAVYVNASTRFTDGFEFGLGAEIGISTQKLHARGPMGLNELTTYKYKVFGTGQVR